MFGTIKQVDCSNKHSFICEMEFKAFGLQKPIWIEYVPGKEYALVYSKSNSPVFGPVTYFEARYVCTNVSHY